MKAQHLGAPLIELNKSDSMMECSPSLAPSQNLDHSEKGICIIKYIVVILLSQYFWLWHIQPHALLCSDVLFHVVKARVSPQKLHPGDIL